VGWVERMGVYWVVVKVCVVGLYSLFFFCGLKGRGPCSFVCLLGLSLLSGIGLDLSLEARVFLS